MSAPENLEEARRERTAHGCLFGQHTVGTAGRLVLLEIRLAVPEEVEVFRVVQVVALGRESPRFKKISVAFLTGEILLLALKEQD